MTKGRAKAPRGLVLLARLALFVAALGLPQTARADAPAAVDAVPDVRARDLRLDALAGLPIASVAARVVGQRFRDAPALPKPAPGATFDPAAARKDLRDLLATGRYASVDLEAEPEGAGVALVYVVVPRRLVAQTVIEGSPLDDEDVIREGKLAQSVEITSASLVDSVERVRALLARRGWPGSSVAVEVRDTDDPMRVVLVLHVRVGPQRTVASRVVVARDRRVPAILDLDEELRSLERGYGVARGDRVDEDALAVADYALEETLQQRGWHRATVRHATEPAGAAARVRVEVDAGPKIATRYEGNRSFDAAQLDDALDLAKDPDRTAAHLAGKLHDRYVKSGFLDAEVAGIERGGPADRVHELVFTVRERPQVKVSRRDIVWCQPPPTGADAIDDADVRSEIDSFLDEELPGTVVSAADPKVVEELLGPTEGAGTHPAPLPQEPTRTYVESTYDRAQKHVQDFLRSQGYLSAAVGPLQVLRRACDPRSPPGACRPLPLRASPAIVCAYDKGLPADEPAYDPALTCMPDPAHGKLCEPDVVLRLPIKLGPRTALYDLAFEGNRALTDAQLAAAADLGLGEPVSQVGVDAARRKVQEALREQGYAFAEVRTTLDLSADHTRARARFTVSEGERVVVDDVVVRGATRTDVHLILGRTTFEKCPRGARSETCTPFRPSDVRKSEERIATLGTFSSVSISLEDPFIPAKHKVVVIQVQERVPQYFDIRPGFSTGEGFRIGFEYGHRNVGGKAIQLTLRVQLSYLPDPFILDPGVRRNFDRLSVGERLERRDTISVVLPEVGMGPLIRLGIDAIDVRNNERDFGLTKQALVPTLSYRPERAFNVQLGGSVERNDVSIFNGDTVEQYLTQPGVTTDLARLLRVPDGVTIAVAQRMSATWDRRDVPFDATRGTLLVASAEHVHAFPAESNANTINSDFLRLTATAAGYVRLTKRSKPTEPAVAFALSVRGGRIYQLTSGSKTYPDRLFFMGGVDSIRGFLQDSVVPEDVAQKILSPDNQAKLDTDATKLTIDQVAIRGGDVFINPRAELRIPLGGGFESGLFLDTGNVWVDPANFQPWKLRYAAGAGLRVGTPIGPLAFDYGINLDPRPWEDFGAFHFSIGLF